MCSGVVDPAEAGAESVGRADQPVVRVGAFIQDVRTVVGLHRPYGLHQWGGSKPHRWPLDEHGMA